MSNSTFVTGRYYLFGLACTASLLAAGCGSGRPKTILVTGTVTYKGQPVQGANVMFECKTGRPAYGITDAEGRFEMETFETGDGAIEGEHTVVIRKMISTSGSVAELDPHMVPPRGGEPLMRNAVPERYGSPTQSPLKATIDPDGQNDFAFELTDE